MKCTSAGNIIFLIFLCNFKTIVVNGVFCKDKATDETCHVMSKWLGCFTLPNGMSLEERFGFELLSKSNPENSSFHVWRQSISQFACECARTAMAYKYAVIAIEFPFVCYGREEGFDNVTDAGSEDNCFRQNQTLKCDQPQSLCVGLGNAVSIYSLASTSSGLDDFYSCSLNMKEKPKHKDNTKIIKSVSPNPKTSYLKEKSEESLRQIYAVLSGSTSVEGMLNLVKDVVEILKRPEIYQDLQVYKKQKSQFMNILSRIIDEPFKDEWKKLQKIQNLVSIIEDVARTLLLSLEYANQTNSDYHYPTPNVDIVANFSSGEKVSIQFSDTVIHMAPKKPSRSAFGTSAIVYKQIKDIFPSARERSKITYKQPMRRIGSSVISIVARQDGKAARSIKGTIRFKINESEIYTSHSTDSLCVYWKENSSMSLGGAWSTHGVSLIDTYHQNNTNETYYTCVTNHLTNFAILMETSDFKISKSDQAALGIITYVGCVLSLLCLLLTIFTLPCIRLKEIRFKIHFNLCIALAAAQIVFLSGINAVEQKIPCMIVAIMLHYFYTVAFLWMLVEGIHLYQKVVVAYEKNRIKKKHYYIMAWGTPVFIVGISAAVRIKGYGTRKGCWLSLQEGFRWAFIGPALFVLLANIIILIRVLTVMINLRSDPLKKQKYAKIRAAIKGVIILLPLLGLTWLFGLMSVNSETIVFQYIFATLNSLQGAFIFILNYALNKEVRASFRRTIQRTTTTSL